MDTYITEIKEAKDKGTITDRLIREMLDAEKKEIEELGKTNPELAIEME